MLFNTQLFSVMLIVLTASVPLHANSKPDAAAQALIDELDLRESKQAMRELPGWQKPKRIVVLLPAGQSAASEQALEALQQVSDGVELVP